MQQNFPKPTPEELKTVSALIGHEFKNPKLLQQALTRKSAILEGQQNKSVGHNERLEFFGDSILRTVVDDYLLEHHPDYGEDQLSEARDNLVSKHGFLSQSAEKIALGRFIIMGTGEQLNFKGAGRKKILADVMEALMAAVFIDSGKNYRVIQQFIGFHAGFQPSPEVSSLASTPIHEQKRKCRPLNTTTVRLTDDSKAEEPVDTLLLKAVESFDLKEVKRLLAHKANPNAVHSMTYLISCPVRCSEKLGAVYLEICQYAKQSNALELAIRKLDSFTENTVPIVRALLESKADPNAHNFKSVAEHSLLHETIMYYPKRADKAKPIFIALCRLLCEFGADVHAPVTLSTTSSSMRVNPLQLAIIFHDVEKVSILLQHGARPNERNSQGYTALHIAALWADHSIACEKQYMRMKLYAPSPSSRLISYSAIIRLLLAHGGDITLRDPVGKRAADLSKEPSLQYLLSPIPSVKHTRVQDSTTYESPSSVSRPSSPPSNEDEDNDDNLQSPSMCRLS